MLQCTQSPSSRAARKIRLVLAAGEDFLKPTCFAAPELLPVGVSTTVDERILSPPMVAAILSIVFLSFF